jgi:hypothetical protein
MDKSKWISFIFGDSVKTRWKRMILSLLIVGLVLFVLLNLKFGYKEGNWYIGAEPAVKEIKINK